MNKEYYGGATALADYLRPSPDKYIPLVELPESLNPYLNEYDIHIDAKLMNTLPLGNVKSLPAWQMLEDAGDVTNKHIIEASSGNTAMSLGLLAPYFGASSVRAIASPDVSEGKLTLLRLIGVSVELVEGPICPNPNDPDGAIAIAHNQGSELGNINLGQYDNESNPKAHEKITGPQLYEQLGNTIGMFCAGLGTTGTLLGTARYLHKQIPHLKVAGIVRAPNNQIPGVRTINGLEEVAFPWDETLTEPIEAVNEKEAYRYSLSMIRKGLLVGPSSGFALAGTLRHLKRLEQTGEIEQLRGKHVVFICPDTPFPYAADYEKILGPKAFPPIKNGILRNQSVDNTIQNPLVPEVDVDKVLGLYTDISLAVEDMKVTGAILIDVRESDEYNDHHLSDSINVPLASIPKWIKFRNDNDSTQVIFICRSGNRSARATYLAKQMDINACNMKGGTVEWSARNYPRIKAPFCTI
jgi:cysteine synthase A